MTISLSHKQKLSSYSKTTSSLNKSIILLKWWCRDLNLMVQEEKCTNQG